MEGMYQTTYEEELEINDFPQSCRWKVTSREAIGNITDFSEADIQIRGVYYPPGKEPGEGMCFNNPGKLERVNLYITHFNHERRCD